MLSDLSEFITEKQPIDFPGSTLATMRFLDIAFYSSTHCASRRHRMAHPYKLVLSERTKRVGSLPRQENQHRRRRISRDIRRPGARGSCAPEIVRAVRQPEIVVRAWVYTRQCDLVRGRIIAKSGPGGVLVSGTVGCTCGKVCPTENDFPSQKAEKAPHSVY